MRIAAAYQNECFGEVPVRRVSMRRSREIVSAVRHSVASILAGKVHHAFAVLFYRGHGFWRMNLRSDKAGRTLQRHNLKTAMSAYDADVRTAKKFKNADSIATGSGRGGVDGRAGAKLQCLCQVVVLGPGRAGPVY